MADVEKTAQVLYDVISDIYPYATYGLNPAHVMPFLLEIAACLPPKQKRNITLDTILATGKAVCAKRYPEPDWERVGFPPTEAERIWVLLESIEEAVKVKKTVLNEIEGWVWQT